MNLGPHAAFIVAAYAAAALVIGALVVWVFTAYRTLTRSIAEFEARGTKRRSER